MNHVMKAAMGWGLSMLPGGRRLHAVVQRRVTHTLPLPDKNFNDRCQIALHHVIALREHFGASIEQLRLFEFGAGWDLIIPQVFRLCGVQRQQLFDLNALAQLDLVRNANQRLRARSTLSCTSDPRFEVATHVLPSVQGLTLDAAFDALGIDYVAPGDAAHTPLPDASVDAVTSSLVLEHVPPDAIAAIFRELHRIVRPGGLVSSTIDPSDHYSHGDARVTPWDFLTYGSVQWRAMNPPLLYQNRLRASEHVAIMTKAGFRMTEVRSTLGGTDDGFARARGRFMEPYSQWSDDRDLRTTRVQVVAVRD